MIRENVKLRAALKAAGLGSDSDILREEKNGNVHKGMMGKLMERGASVESIIEESWDSKRANVGVVVHDEKERVLDYILAGSSVGAFRREIIHEGGDGEGGRIMFWQHYGGQ